MSIQKLGTIYKNLLKDHPVIVQALQTGVLMASGDLLAQTAIERKSFEQIQPIRTSQFFSLGAGLVGPAMVVWYKVLSKTIGNGSKSAVVKKVAADQLIFAPTFTVIFLSVLSVIQGKDFEQLQKELRAKYVDIMLNNYKFWPAVQLVNFYLLPLNYQVLLVQTVALFWNAYLSWKTQQEV